MNELGTRELSLHSMLYVSRVHSVESTLFAIALDRERA